MKSKSDFLVAGSVILCSVILFVALSMGLSGRSILPNAQSVRVRFPDITGIKLSSQVRYGGAPAGTVSAVRILTAAERASSPANLVEITLRLHPEVPPLVTGTQVSIAADTLLSDKFVLIQGGPLEASPLGAEGYLEGIAPTSFDKLVRNADDAIDGLRRTLGGSADGTGDVLAKAEKALNEASELFAAFRPVVNDAGSLMSDARSAAASVKSLVEDNQADVSSTVKKLNAAATDLESLADRAERLVRESESPINTTLDDFKVSLENLKVTSTYAKFLLNDLALRPTRLIWGTGKAPALPSERTILNSRKPIPLQ